MISRGKTDDRARYRLWLGRGLCPGRSAINCGISRVYGRANQDQPKGNLLLDLYKLNTGAISELRRASVPSVCVTW